MKSRFPRPDDGQSRLIAAPAASEYFKAITQEWRKAALKIIISNEPIENTYGGF